MVRSRLPVPSLLVLFGALLMVFPELPAGVSHMGLTHVGLEKALAFAVEKYNQDTLYNANYFKQLYVHKSMAKVENWDEYHFRMELVETTCEKKAGKIRSYKEILECEPFPWNPKKRNCYLKVRALSGSNEMYLATTNCN